MSVHVRPEALTAAPDPRAVLADPAATLAQVMAAVDEVEATAPFAATTHVGISAGATVDLLGVYLRRHALLAGVRLAVSQGDFDNPLEDLARFGEAGVEHVVFAPSLDTLAPAFEARAALLTGPEIDALEDALRCRWRAALQRAAAFRTVFLCGLHRTGAALPGGDALDEIVHRLNHALREEARAFANIRWLDRTAMIGELGRRAALDMRHALRSSAPYTPALLDEWARQVTSVSWAYGTRFHKALVLDCDNTLWGGVVGEDGAAGIKLSASSFPGNVFHRVQTEFLALQRQGVLLCLCSKNDPEAVTALMGAHPDMVLQSADIVAAQMNWDDKPTNLRRIAETLNIGLDSLVFLDDSAFECEAVRSQLPEVTVFQVPQAPKDYLAVVEQIRDLFLAGGPLTDGAGKTEQYRRRAAAIAEQTAFDSQDAYLASLGLTVILSRDAPSSAARIAELSQKSNQFNLTTIRYTAAEIERLMSDPAAAVYAVEVADRFGSAGLTGAAIVRDLGEAAVIEALFMSCRVLGRGAEFALWPTLLADAQGRGRRRLRAAYRPTPKNGQTADFYDRLGLFPCGGEDGARFYEAEIGVFAPSPPAWIEVRHAG